jgi:hypothetical protein
MRINHKAAAIVASLAVMAGGTGVAYAATCPGMDGSGAPASTTGTTTTSGSSTTGTTTSSSTTNAPRLAHHRAVRHAGRQ